MLVLEEKSTWENKTVTCHRLCFRNEILARSAGNALELPYKAKIHIPILFLKEKNNIYFLGLSSIETPYIIFRLM